MKRRSLKQLRAKLYPAQHHNAYVVLTTQALALSSNATGWLLGNSRKCVCSPGSVNRRRPFGNCSRPDRCNIHTVQTGSATRTQQGALDGDESWTGGPFKAIKGANNRMFMDAKSICSRSTIKNKQPCALRRQAFVAALIFTAVMLTAPKIHADMGQS